MINFFVGLVAGFVIGGGLFSILGSGAIADQRNRADQYKRVISSLWCYMPDDYKKQYIPEKIRETVKKTMEW